jgi:UDPglucose 6-dehydrogenase
MKIKNICCIGAGYVGGPTMIVIANKCPEIEVNVVDQNNARIAAWNSDQPPVFEPGLNEMLFKVRGKNLFFNTQIEECVEKADCVFISVNTPTKETGLGKGKASDLRYLESCTRTIAKAAKGYTIIVEKSTLPVRSAETVRTVLNSIGSGKAFDVISNPEFLAEGSAIEDLCNPDRVLIGGDNPVAIEAITAIYARWVPERKIIQTNLWSAEMAKLTANAFLAQRVSSINSISAFCEATGANISEVAKAVGSDSRIGPKFLKAGVGFGGSCFKKDILNLVYLCEYHGLHQVAEYWRQVVALNEWQKLRISNIIIEKLFNTLACKKIAILGFAFKKNTNDTREAPSISVCKHLLEEGARLSIYDPKVPKARIYSDLGFEDPADNRIECVENAVEACSGADAVVLLTDWDEFETIGWQKISSKMQKPAWIFDTRGCVNQSDCKNAGLNLWVVGIGVIM